MKSSLVIKFLPFAAAVIMVGCSENNDYDATGIFEATTVTVSAETSGRILSFPVEEGDSVYAGQQVAQIDSTMLMLQLAQLGSQAHGLGVRAGEQQLRGKAGTAQTSGDVQPRGKREAHV